MYHAAKNEFVLQYIDAILNSNNILLAKLNSTSQYNNLGTNQMLNLLFVQDKELRVYYWVVKSRQKDNKNALEVFNTKAIIR